MERREPGEVFEVFLLVGVAVVGAPGVPDRELVEPQHVHHSAKKWNEGKLDAFLKPKLTPYTRQKGVGLSESVISRQEITHCRYNCLANSVTLPFVRVEPINRLAATRDKNHQV